MGHIVCDDGLPSDNISLHWELIRMGDKAGRDSMLPVKITNFPADKAACVYSPWSAGKQPPLECSESCHS